MINSSRDLLYKFLKAFLISSMSISERVTTNRISFLSLVWGRIIGDERIGGQQFLLNPFMLLYNSCAKKAGLFLAHLTVIEKKFYVARLQVYYNMLMFTNINLKYLKWATNIKPNSKDQARYYTIHVSL